MKTNLVIGGSGGIGKALVQKLLKHSAVINVSRTAPELEHPNLKHMSCDVLNEALPDLDHVDTLVYCPGSITLKPITHLSIDDFKEDFNVNVLGAIKSIQKYLPVLKKGDDPSILLFSSVAVKLGMPFHASIGTAKAGLEGLVKSLAAELAPGIRVNAIAPTVTNTPLASKLLRNDRMVEQIINRHPLKRILEPEEVAHLAEFLLSHGAKSLSGQIFQMDSGIVTLKV
ncbi:SDR family NAD(P)-dependent oxidoreductase [Aestuariivivens sediminis]|uniref:SDR family NAD(P)-dependent oxidoreductase n=1 Tax=Aestuariivivens sediminis TaxID=2913557 RepID=UPI001F59AAD8|nr:SDR family oxidoreductase [Aestuariivivens sediminis]